jgi:hypothetical protein
LTGKPYFIRLTAPEEELLLFCMKLPENATISFFTKASYKV